MKTKLMLAICIVTALVLLNGCGGKGVTKTGFLSDYSKLQKESDSSMRYVNDAAGAKYSSFIVDPVKVYFPSGSKSKGKLTAEQITDLTNYMHAKIVQAVEGAGKKIAYQPGPGVARVRVALTDIQKTSAINLLPQASLLGAGVGGASMEGEVVDSMTGEQIGAAIDSGKGGRIPFTNLGAWSAAKGVMDDWADRFQKRLESSR